MTEQKLKWVQIGFEWHLVIEETGRIVGTVSVDRSGVHEIECNGINERYTTRAFAQEGCEKAYRDGLVGTDFR
jgi:hypothetical protein